MPTKIPNDPINFIHTVCIDPETRQPFQLYRQQRQFLRFAFELTPAGKLRHSELVFSAPKKSGKTAMAALMAIYTGVVLAGIGGEIYCLANDLEQSQSRVFKAIVSICQASPLLRNSVDVTINKIVLRSTGTTISAVANDYQGFAGANPTLNVYDESAYFTSENSRRLWDEGLPSPARKISFRLSVSTAGFDGEPSPLRDLYDRALSRGVEIAPDLRRHNKLLCYWTHDLHAPWQTAEWVDDSRVTLRPVQFQRLIENRWVSSESQFIDLADWDACTNPALRPVLNDRDLMVYAGLDCSVRGDHTALAVVSYDDENNIVKVTDHKVLKPSGGDINFAQVESLIQDIGRRFSLVSVNYDPYQCEAVAQRLRLEGVNMQVFNQTPANLEAAASNLLNLVVNRNLATYPSDELRQAIANCRSIETVRGWRISKIVGSRKIDLAAALSFASLACVREHRGEPGLLVWARNQSLGIENDEDGDGAEELMDLYHAALNAGAPAAPESEAELFKNRGLDPNSTAWIDGRWRRIRDL